MPNPDNSYNFLRKKTNLENSQFVWTVILGGNSYIFLIYIVLGWRGNIISFLSYNGNFFNFSWDGCISIFQAWILHFPLYFISLRWRHKYFYFLNMEAEVQYLAVFYFLRLEVEVFFIVFIFL